MKKGAKEKLVIVILKILININNDKYQIDDRGRYVRWSTEIESTAALYSTFLSFPFLSFPFLSFSFLSFPPHLSFPILSYHLLLCSTTPSSALSSHFTLLFCSPTPFSALLSTLNFLLPVKVE